LTDSHPSRGGGVIRKILDSIVKVFDRHPSSWESVNVGESCKGMDGEILIAYAKL
jgi:hypothetical protein